MEPVSSLPYSSARQLSIMSLFYVAYENDVESTSVLTLSALMNVNTDALKSNRKLPTVACSRNVRNCYQTIRHYIPEDIPHSHCCWRVSDLLVRYRSLSASSLAGGKFIYVHPYHKISKWLFAGFSSPYTEWR